MLTLLFAALSFASAQAETGDAAADVAAVRTCLERSEDEAACRGIIADPCMERPGGETTQGMVSCTFRETTAWDTLLNERYRELMAAERINDENGYSGRADQLQDAQRAWIELRDADCIYEADQFQGGSMARVVEAGCHLGRTADRAIWLGRMITGG